MDIKIKTAVETVETLSEKMKTKDKVFFTRFGDNDIYQMVGCGPDALKLRNRPIGNNGTHYTQEQSDAIKMSFDIKHDDYMKAVTHLWPVEEGMHGTVFDRRPKKELHKLLSNYIKHLTDEREFYNPVPFHYLSIFRPEIMLELLNELIRPVKNKLYIGWINPWTTLPTNITLEDVFGEFCAWCPVAQQDSFNMASQQTIEEILRESEQADVIISAAGQLSRALSGLLWTYGINTHYIDFGSIVDGLAGFRTRNWNIKYGKTVIKNLL